MTTSTRHHEGYYRGYRIVSTPGDPQGEVAIFHNGGLVDNSSTIPEAHDTIDAWLNAK